MDKSDCSIQQTWVLVKISKGDLIENTGQQIDIIEEMEM